MEKLAIKRINGKIERIFMNLGKNGYLYNDYEDFIITNKIEHYYKNGYIQISYKRNSIKTSQLISLDQMLSVGELQKKIRNGGEKVTKDVMIKADWVLRFSQAAIDYIYWITGQRNIPGLTGVKGKKSYSEIYNAIMQTLEKYGRVNDFYDYMKNNIIGKKLQWNKYDGEYYD